MNKETMKHILKTDPAVFQAVTDGAKTYEIRLNDRGFVVGDELLLRETTHTGAEIALGAALEFTGREITKHIGHVLDGYGLKDGWVILSFAERTTSPVSALTDDLAGKFWPIIAAATTIPEHEVSTLARKLADLAAAAPAAAIQQESIDTPEFREILAEWYNAVGGSYEDEWDKRIVAHINAWHEANKAAAVAKARLEGMQEAQGALSANDDFYNRWIDEQRRAERAEAALAQPVDLSKLTRYGEHHCFVRGNYVAEDPEGGYCLVSDVEQLLAAAPAAPYPTRECAAEALTPSVKEATNTFGAWECPKCGAESSDGCPHEFCYVNADEEAAQPQPVAEHQPDALAASDAEFARIKHERDVLAEGIAEAARKAGVWNGETALTGPHLLMFCNDMAECIAVSQQAAEPVAWPNGWTVKRIGDGIHITRADGKWTGFIPASGPAHELTYEFLSAMLAAPAIQQPQDSATLTTIREAVLTYYDALSARQHGGLAQDKAFSAIQEALGMSWQFGVDHRAALAKKGGAA